MAKGSWIKEMRTENKQQKELLNHSEKIINKLQDELLTKEAIVILLENKINQLEKNTEEPKIILKSVNKLINKEQLARAIFNVTKIFFDDVQCQKIIEYYNKH